MTQKLQQNFVDLASTGLRPNGSTKLRLYHAERRFDVAPLVIMLQERLSIEVVEVPHPLPKTIYLMAVPAYNRIDFEGNISGPAYGFDCPQIALAQIGFVRRHFIRW